MNKILVLSLVVAALMAVPLVFVAPVARADPTTISIIPTPRTVSSGLANFTLAIRVTNVTNLWMWKANITWDSSVLSLASNGIAEGPFLATSGKSTLFTAAPIIPGQLREITGSILDTAGVNGNGDVAYLTFTFNATKYGNTTISITDVAMFDPSNPHVGITTASTNARVYITVPGDVSSTLAGFPEGLVNMRDISYIITHFNTRPTSPNWDVNLDVNGDNVVNMRDISIAILNFNKHI